MNKLANIFEGFNIGGFILGISLADIYSILGIISFLVSIISGIVVIVLKIKNASADGKITKEEIEDIEKSIENLEDKLKK